jgi:uncharacterized integral membrane protein
MPWKLIGFLTILTLFLIFAGFNTHPVTIYFGPFKIEEIPMFVSLFMSFLAGAIIVIPFSLLSSFKKKKKMEERLKATPQKSTEESTVPIEAPQEDEGSNNINDSTHKKEKKKTLKKLKKK